MTRAKIEAACRRLLGEADDLRLAEARERLQTACCLACCAGWLLALNGALLAVYGYPWSGALAGLAGAGTVAMARALGKGDEDAC